MLKSFIAILIFLLGGFTIFYGNTIIINQEKQKWENKKAIIHDTVLDDLNHSIDHFALLATYLKNFIENSGSLPSSEVLQKFIRQQFTHVEFQDSIIVSILDVDHNFISSVNRISVDPSRLIGTNVRDYREEKSIERLNAVLEDNELHLFRPHNLLEGWVGISLNFRLVINNEVVGYVNAIIDFKNLMEDIYTSQITDEFCFRFMTGDGIEFDREHVYDDSQFAQDRSDPEYYKNFKVVAEDFLASEINRYGLVLNIGTSYKKSFSPDYTILIFSGVWYLVFSFMVFYIVRQSRSNAEVNQKLQKVKKKLEDQKLQLEAKNKELEESNTSKSKFFSIIGHDLKSPLRSIHTLINLRKDNIIPLEEADAMLTDLQEHVGRTTKLVDDLMEWAKLNRENPGTRFKRNSVYKIAHDIIDLTENSTTLKEITVTSNFEGQLEIDCDENMVATLFRNIISNAIKFTHRKGTINIEGKDLDDHIEVIIQDSGVGMNEHEVKTLFNIDRDPGSKGTEGESGSGLGLILCKEYVDLHNGQMKVKSQEGVGSTFTVILPKTQGISNQD